MPFEIYFEHEIGFGRNPDFMYSKDVAVSFGILVLIPSTFRPSDLVGNSDLIEFLYRGPSGIIGN